MPFAKYVLLWISLNAIVFVAVGELGDSMALKTLCYPELVMQDTRKSCECHNNNVQPWGIRAIYIDCSFKDIKSTDLTALPLYTDVLDLTWNLLTEVPQLTSESLTVLNLMHNNISTIKANNFAKCTGLQELYLSWNSIQSVEQQAFNGLTNLKILDLSHNNIHTLPLLTFGSVKLLENLSLSWNRRLNETIGSELNFYQQFGVSAQLSILKLEACSLASLNLSPDAALVELVARKNVLTSIPTLLPTALKRLDLSENMLKTLSPADTAAIPQLRVLFLEDMPVLEAVEENAFVALQSLQTMSFQNSRRLRDLNAYSFGIEPPAVAFPDLHTIVLRGTLLHNLNSTLANIFGRLAELDLNGAPLCCDCELLWLKRLGIETHGRCFKPDNLRGLLVSEADASEFGCNKWPHWVKGLIILLLIALCSVGIYLIVMGLRPYRGVTMRSKVGSTSPYARVTIEPNRQEVN